MKYVFARDLLPHLQDMLNLLGQAENEGGSHFVIAALTYLFKTGEVSDNRQFLEIVQNHLSPETGENIMTIAQQIRQEGIEKGMQQGMQQGIEKNRKEIAKKLQQQGFPLATISQITELSITQLQSLLAEKVTNH